MPSLEPRTATESRYGSTVEQRELKTAIASALLLAASIAGAQSASAQGQTEDSGGLEEITVSASRVMRDGFEAPTPVMVLGVEEMQATPSANLAEFVNQIPSVVGSVSPQNSNTSISSGGAGVNAINLRNMEAVRTLVLLDGQRSVGSLLNGTVDVNTFPQALVERVEVVTGGASAAYGSDAVSGVVNFILDKDFTGVKADLDYGQTTYGDDEGWKASLAFGTPFAGGRGHVLISGEAADRAGILHARRDWNNDGWYQINNPAYEVVNGVGNGEPERLIANNAALSLATYGGLITANPGTPTTANMLRGIAFGPGGVPYQFAYGDQVKDPWMIGGQWEANQFNDRQALNAAEERQGVFTRVSYGITDNVNLFAQASWNYVDSEGITGVQFNQGNVIIRADNAFIPDSVAQTMQANAITQFTMGTMNADLPLRRTDNSRTVTRYVVGADGTFDMLGDEWNWNAYYQNGTSETSETARDITNNARLALATDAVRDPVTGAIVCRSTRDIDPNNGCVPFNRLGIGVNNQAALDYIIGHPHREQEFTQDVAAVAVTGEPFSNWAGPVSLAFGVEHRREEVTGFVPEGDSAGWFVGNYLPSFGKYNVTEGFIETVVPLANDLPFAESLELNAAVRATDYSTSGYVTTWKVGATWSPIEDIRFRVTRSRDIRAPNLQELFQAGGSNTNNVIDPFNNDVSVQYTGFQTGNLDLIPEEADTLGVGIVLQPRFLPGFSASVDYFNIELENAIDTVAAQDIVDRCFEGAQSFCDAITRGISPGGASIITQIRISPFNFVELVARGVDMEASYRLPAGPGDLTFRALATHYLKRYENDGESEPTDTVGSNSGNGPPDWVYRASISYDIEPVRLTLTGRGVSSGVYDTSFIECTSGCPTSTVTNRTINNNQIDGAFYLDANVAYRFQTGGDSEIEAFFNVRNLTNKDPAIVAAGPAGSSYGTISANPTLYDQLGRIYRAGVRIRM